MFVRWRARIIISSNEKRGERERKKGDVEWPKPLKEPWNGLGSQVVKEKKETRERKSERNKEEKKKGNKKKAGTAERRELYLLFCPI